jgi:hypothetical protein
MSYSRTLAISFILLLIIAGCDGGKMTKVMNNYSSLKEVPASKWKELSTKTIFFGHQSVGNNIIDGIQDIIVELPEINLNIVDLGGDLKADNGALVHSRVGKNRDPKSKMAAFEKKVQNGLGRRLDIAALKFCYVDILSKSDPKLIFKEYKETIARVKKDHKNMTVIHFTVPLKTLETGVKAWLKKIAGKPLKGMNDNIKRCEYNDLLKAEFTGKDPILDIAQIESTAPDGQRSKFSINGKTYYSLLPAYTYDGGHLNKVGRKAVATQFLLMLVNNS